MKTLELFSGIGGMHFALKESQINGEIVRALEINTTANSVYIYNFPQTNLCQNNVQLLTPDYINQSGIELILMSPPCQPFTRQGKKLDIEDKRCCALLHIINLIPHFNETLKYILLENVDGFQNSDACKSLIDTLKRSQFNYKELLLNPQHLKFPNSRLRYYLLAKRKPLAFSEELNMQSLCDNVTCIGDILEIPDTTEEYDQYLLNDNTLKKRAWVLDIVTKKSDHSCCFTRGYTHYIEGTGSVYCPFDDINIKETYEKVKNLKNNSSDNSNNDEEILKLLKELKLRYFTPREIANLLCFPKVFSFPNNVANKQKYRLLGNSINVKIVGKLIQMLITERF